MARGDKDYGDEGKTSFAKKSKLAPAASPRAKAKPTVSTKAVRAPAKKVSALAPSSSKRPRTLNDWANDRVKDGISDAALRKKAEGVKKPGTEMSRQDRKKAGLPVSPIGKFLAKVNAPGTAKKRERK